MGDILLAVSDTEVLRLQEGLRRVWRFFAYDLPDFPGEGPPRRPRVGTRGGRRGGGAAAFGANDESDGDSDGDGGAGHRRVDQPWDAMEMIMATLRRKLELRERARPIEKARQGAPRLGENV